MNVQQKNSNYYVSKLCSESFGEGKVKKKALIKCLKAVSNSASNMKYYECNESIGKLRHLLSSRGSKKMNKKQDLLSSILSCSVKFNYNIDELQHCNIKMRFKRNYEWRKDFGVSNNEANLHLNDDLAKALKFRLLSRKFLADEKKVISGIERNLSLSKFRMKL